MPPITTVASGLCTQALQVEKLYRLGEQRFFAEVDKETHPPVFYYYPECQAPAGAGLLWIAWIYAVWIVLKYLHDKFMWERRHILYHFGEKGADNINRYRTLIPPADEYWTDSFVYRRDGIDYVYFEVFCRKSKKGHLSVMRLESDEQYSVPVKVLDTDYHISYPCWVEAGGVLYMIPESMANKNVALYQCVEFPHKWEFKMNLMENVSTVDTIPPLYHNGKWWLFTTMTELAGTRAREDLFVFYADELCTNQWTPYPLQSGSDRFAGGENGRTYY